MPAGSDEVEHDARAFGLGLVDDGGQDVLVIRGLTQGEVRWMAEELWASRKGQPSGGATRVGHAGALWDRWLDEGA